MTETTGTPPEDAFTADSDLPKIFGTWGERIEAWAMSGPWWQQALKTPLTHALVWVGTTLIGAIAGLVLIYAFGLYPVWALAVPLFGFSWGQSFYWNREYGPEGDSRAGGWKKKVDSALDFWVPKLVGTAAMYGIGALYLHIAGIL